MDAANYYDTCMNTKQIEAVGDDPMKELIKKLGQYFFIKESKFLRGQVDT